MSIYRLQVGGSAFYNSVKKTINAVRQDISEKASSCVKLRATKKVAEKFTQREAQRVVNIYVSKSSG